MWRGRIECFPFYFHFKNENMYRCKTYNFSFLLNEEFNMTLLFSIGGALSNICSLS